MYLEKIETTQERPYRFFPHKKYRGFCRNIFEYIRNDLKMIRKQLNIK
jgi:hypothetical protein